MDGETVSERTYEYSKEGQLKNMVKKDGAGKVWRWLEVKMDEQGRVIEQHYFKKYGTRNELVEIRYLEYDSLNRLIKKRIVNKQFKVEDKYRIYKYFANGDIEISNVSLSNRDSIVKRIFRLNKKMETIAQLGRNGEGFDGGYNYLNEMGQVVKSKSTIGNRTSITEYDENGDRVSFKLFEDGKEIDVSHLGKSNIQYFYGEKNNWIKKIEYGNLQCFCTEREITYRD